MGLQALEVGVVYILGLHVAHRVAVGAGGDHVVGRAAGYACRFVGHEVAREQLLQVGLQGRAVAVLGGLASAVLGIEGGEVLLQGHGGVFLSRGKGRKYSRGSL